MTITTGSVPENLRPMNKANNKSKKKPKNKPRTKDKDKKPTRYYHP
jgi:hypothetical protein